MCSLRLRRVNSGGVKTGEIGRFENRVLNCTGIGVAGHGVGEGVIRREPVRMAVEAGYADRGMAQENASVDAAPRQLRRR